MSNRFSFDGFGVAGILFGIASFAYAVYQTNKQEKLDREVRDKMSMSLDSIAARSSIDIEQSIIDNAINKTVERKVNQAAAEAIAAVKLDMQADISKRVKKEVEQQYQTLTDQVSERIANDVAAISDDALSNRVLPKVEQKLMKRGDEMLQQVRDAQTKELEKSMNLINGVKNAILSGTGLNGGNQNRGIRLTYD